MAIRSFIFITLILTLPLALLAKQETLEEMIQHADSAQLKDQPKLYMEIARNQLKEADKQFTVGNSEAAQAAVKNIVQYAQRSADTSVQSGKRLKDTEIDLRKIADKLRDINHTLTFEDQEPVKAAADKIEDMRTELLKRMFGKNKK